MLVMEITETYSMSVIALQYTLSLFILFGFTQYLPHVPQT
jgi:hypothetical protein